MSEQRRIMVVNWWSMPEVGVGGDRKYLVIFNEADYCDSGTDSLRVAYGKVEESMVEGDPNMVRLIFIRRAYWRREDFGLMFRRQGDRYAILSALWAYESASSSRDSEKAFANLKEMYRDEDYMPGIEVSFAVDREREFYEDPIRVLELYYANNYDVEVGEEEIVE